MATLWLRRMSSWTLTKTFKRSMWQLLQIRWRVNILKLQLSVIWVVMWISNYGMLSESSLELEDLINELFATLLCSSRPSDWQFLQRERFKLAKCQPPQDFPIMSIFYYFLWKFCRVGGTLYQRFIYQFLTKLLEQPL